MKPEEVLKAVKKYGSCRAAGRELGVSHSYISRTVKKLCKRQTDERPAAQPAADTAEAYTGGISLSPSVRVLERRPPVTVRSKFFSLPKGKAFKIADLAKRWGFSAETVKRHAKDENCFAYVDTTGHDDFEECVMHPDTAEARMKGN